MMWSAFWGNPAGDRYSSSQYYTDSRHYLLFLAC